MSENNLSRLQLSPDGEGRREMYIKYRKVLICAQSFHKKCGVGAWLPKEHNYMDRDELSRT